MKSQKYSNYIKAKYIRCFVCGTKKPKSILNEKKQEIHNDLNNNNEPSRSKKIFNYLFSIYSISYIFFLIYCVIVMFGTKEELLSAFLLLFSVQSIVTIFSIVKTYKFIENNFDSTYNKISKRFLINMIIIFLIYFFLDFFNSKFIENEFLKYNSSLLFSVVLYFISFIINKNLNVSKNNLSIIIVLMILEKAIELIVFLGSFKYFLVLLNPFFYFNSIIYLIPSIVASLVKK